MPCVAIVTKVLPMTAAQIVYSDVSTFLIHAHAPGSAAGFAKFQNNGSFMCSVAVAQPFGSLPRRKKTENPSAATSTPTWMKSVQMTARMPPTDV